MIANIRFNAKKFTLTIDKEEEELVRAAAERVDEMILAVTNKFQDEEFSKEDILALVAYQSILKRLKIEKEYTAKPYKDKINELDKLIIKALDNNTI